MADLRDRRDRAASPSTSHRSRRTPDDHRVSRRSSPVDRHRPAHRGARRDRTRSPSGDRHYRPSHRSRDDDRPRRHSPDRRDRDRERDTYRGGRSRRSPPRRARTPEPTDDERDRRTVFVQQLAARLRTHELQQFFSQIGPVKDAQIVKDRVSGRSKG